jgi:hypothetical protein
MDDAVARSLAKWPNVPAVYGWLELDRRGNWRIRSGYANPPRFEKIGNAALRDFIARNYEADQHGRWYFQNGPQRVFVKLAYTPLVVHFEGDALVDQCGNPFRVLAEFLDDKGSVVLQGERSAGLLDDRDLERYADRGEALAHIRAADVPVRFGFVQVPGPVP